MAILRAQKYEGDPVDGEVGCPVDGPVGGEVGGWGSR